MLRMETIHTALKKIHDLSEAYFDYSCRCYRHLHAHPELSFCEFETSAFVCSELDKMGIEYRSGFGTTGVLGLISGKKSPLDKTVALRADMDALPLSEGTNLPWKSLRDGVMHACGHDAHTASLLGAARILKDMEDSFSGRVLLVFQPGEEKSPGGARLMLEDGVFEDWKPDMIIGQHVSPDYPTGTLAFREGRVMASADEIHIKIRGKGGHGALPHLLNDTVLAASQSIVALQQLRSRLCHPLTPMVLSFGSLIAEGATNVIPSEVRLSGSLRTMDELWREQAKEHIRRIVTATCDACGCCAEIDIPEGYPCVDNHPQVTQAARRFAEEYLGKESVRDMEVRMTSEDFGFFTQCYPATFYRLGIRGKENAQAGGLHTTSFRIDEEALKTGSGALAYLAWRFLEGVS